MLVVFGWLYNSQGIMYENLFYDKELLYNNDFVKMNLNVF